MKKVIVVLAVILCSCFAIAQDLPKVEVFGGYAFTSVDTKAASRRSFNGWDADVAARISKNFSIVGDISGAYKTETPPVLGIPGPTPSDLKLRNYNYLFGPRISFPTGKVTPFAHALFGVGHSTISTEVSGISVSLASNGFAMALGGGLDYSVKKRIGIRLVKFEYLLNHFSNDTLGTTISENLNNFRIATGIVFKF